MLGESDLLEVGRHSSINEWITKPVELDGVHKVTYEWVETGSEAMKLSWKTLETCPTDYHGFPAPWDETDVMRERVSTAWEVEYHTGQYRDGEAHWKTFKCVYVDTTEVAEEDSSAVDKALLQLRTADAGMGKTEKFMGKAVGFMGFEGGEVQFFERWGDKTPIVSQMPSSRSSLHRARLVI